MLQLLHSYLADNSIGCVDDKQCTAGDLTSAQDAFAARQKKAEAVVMAALKGSSH